jgi:DNA-binding MarR family transcriptional regulator
MIDVRMADDHAFKTLKMNLLSTEGKILSVLISHPECMTKDIPVLAGVSTRTAYECINKLADMGLVEKARSAKDGRSKYVRLLPDTMCEKICARYL